MGVGDIKDVADVVARAGVPCERGDALGEMVRLAIVVVPIGAGAGQRRPGG